VRIRDEFMERLARIFKTLGNKRRLRIIELLFSNNRMTVGKISEHLGLSFKSTSKHLQQLESVGLLDKQQIGTHVFYFLSKNLKKSINNDILNVLKKYLNEIKR